MEQFLLDVLKGWRGGGSVWVVVMGVWDISFCFRHKRVDLTSQKQRVEHLLTVAVKSNSKRIASKPEYADLKKKKNQVHLVFLRNV